MDFVWSAEWVAVVSLIGCPGNGVCYLRGKNGTLGNVSLWISFILHRVNGQSCLLDSKFLLELRLIVYHKLLRHGLFCYFSRAKWLEYEAALVACRSEMTAQCGVETGGVFVSFSCCVVFKLSECCDILRLWLKQAWTRDGPICAATPAQAGWLRNHASIPVRRKKLLSFRKRLHRFPNLFPQR